MIRDLHPLTKAVIAVSAAVLLLTVLSYNGWVLSVTLRRFTLLVAAASILLPVSVLLLVADAARE